MSKRLASVFFAMACVCSLMAATVTVGPVTPATSVVTAGTQASFGVKVSGGATNKVAWTTLGNAGIWDTFGNWTAPIVAGTYTITATSEDDATQSSSTTVTIVAAPVAAGFAASKTPATTGVDTITLTPIYSGGKATITYSGGTIACPASGVATGPISVDWSGIRKYTLNVSNAAGAWAQVYCIVTAVATPTVDGLAASTTAPLRGGTFTLKPAYRNGTASLAYSGSGTGTISCPADGVETPPIKANWKGARYHTLSAKNAAGTIATTTVAVTPQDVILSSISPAAPTMSVGSAQTFSASMVSGGVTGALSWTSSGGTFDASAPSTWIAPSVPGTYTITATSVDDLTQVVSATATVVAAPVAAKLQASTVSALGVFSLTPTYSGGTATITYSGGSVTCPASGVATSAITAAWSGSRVYTLTVTNAAGTVASTTTSVTAPAGVNIGAVTPAASTLTIGASASFGVSVAGGATNTVTWSSTAGTWSGNTWTAPATPGVYTITATSVDNNSKTASTTVTVTSAPIATSLVSSATTVAQGYSQFTLVPTYSNGTATITYPGGSVTCPGSGVATAPISVNWAGTRTFTLTVTNSLGAWAQVYCSVASLATPTASLASANNPVPYGGMTTITPTFTGGTASVNQGVGNVTSGTGFSSGVITASKSFTLTVTNSLGAVTTGSLTLAPQTVALSPINPAATTKTVGTSTLFSSTSTGGATNGTIWSATSGTFSGATWTAPGTPGTYTITATSADDASKSVSTTVTVVATPVAGSLSASNLAPAYNSSVALTPTFSAGTGAVDNSIGAVTSGSAASVTANWLGAKTFTLTVTNAAGTAVTTSISVTPQVAAVGVVAPAAQTMTAGASMTFSATATGGATNNINWSATGNAGSWSGSTWTAPATPGAYTITATSADDASKSASTTITVVAAPVAESLSASSLTPAYNGTFSLTPTFSAGTGAVDNSIGAVTSGSAASVTANWLGAKTFTLTVTNAAGTAVTTSVIVTPQIVGVSAISPAATTKTVGTAQVYSATATGGATNNLTWTANGGSFSGSTWTAPATAGNYTITATSIDDATKSNTTTVTVVAAPVAASLVAVTNPVLYGGSTNITPTFSAGTGAVDQSIGAATSGTAFSSGALTAPKTFLLTVTNTAVPAATATTSITITVQSALVAAISPAAPTMTVNGATTFASSVSGASNTGLTWSASAGTINASTGAFTAPASAQSVTITATSQADGTKTATTTVTVVAAPAISTFVPAAATITAGSSTTLTGTFSGGNGSVDNSVGAVSSTVAKTVTPASTTTYTLTVTNAATVPAAASTTAQTTVTVVAAPAATSLTASTVTPAYGATFTLTPVYANGTGAIDQSVSCPATGSASAAITANWLGAKTFTLTVTNAAGTAVTTSVVVTPQIVGVSAISPAATTKTVGTAQVYSATATGGATNNLTWTANGGSFSGSTWTAPATAGNYTITATSIDDATKSNTTTVTVVAAATGSIAISNATPAYKSTNITVTPSFTGGTAKVGTTLGGSDISASATSGAPIAVQASGFTAATTYYLRVTNTASDSIDATPVTGTPTTVVAGAVTPAAATKTVSTTQVYNSTPTGGATNTVTWSATGGSFSGATWTAPATAGNYTITSTSVDDASKTASTGVTVVSLPTTPVVTTPSYVTASQAGYTASVPSQSGSTYAWTITNGTITAGATTTSITFTAGASGTTTPSCIVTNAGGTASTAGTATSAVVAPPTTPTITTPLIVTALKAGYSASVSTQAGSSYAWSITGGTITDGATSMGISYTPGASGSVGLSCTVTNRAGTSATGTVSVTVVPPPQAIGLIFYANGASLYNPPYGTAFTLVPTYADGTPAITSAGGSVTCPATGVQTGVQTANFSGTRTYTLHVTDAAGTWAEVYAWMTPQVVAISPISPAAATKTVSTTQVYSATATNGATNNLTWTATGGSFSGSTWTAPATPGSYTITATSVDDPSKSNSTTVTVLAVPVISSFSAAPANISMGQSTTLTGVFTGGTGSVNNSIGTVTSGVGISTGILQYDTTYTLTVTNSATPAASVTATLPVPVSRVVVASVSPATISLSVNTSQAFTASVTGGTTNTVAWTATGGTITSGGAYTAPATPGTYTITATSTEDGTKSASATVTVVALPVATSLVPSNTTPLYGASVTLMPTFSNGTGVIDNGIGTATSGTASSAITTSWVGARTYTLTVTNAATTAATATTAGTITPQTVVVAAISPASKTLSATKTFTASSSVTGALDSSIDWSVDGIIGGNATVGTISAGGLYTAPATAGTHTIAATSHANASVSQSMTATVVLLPTIGTALTATPSSINYGGTSVLSAVFSNGTAALVGTPGSTNQAVTSPVSFTTPVLNITTSYVLTVTNAAGDTATGNATVTVSEVTMTALPSPNPTAPDPANYNAVTLSTATSTETYAFGATVGGGVVSGAVDSSVIWLVNGVVGGNSEVGLISASGIYTTPINVPSATAPATGRTVIITCKSVAEAEITQSLTLSLHDAPAISGFGVGGGQ